MTLIEHILKSVQSKDTLTMNQRRSKYTSPPPELDEAFIEKRIFKKKKKIVNRYADVVAKVDTSPPALQPRYMFHYIENWSRHINKLFEDNYNLVTEIKKQHNKGKVDCHWDRPPKQLKEFYEKRRDFLKRVEAHNKVIYERITATKARVTTTASLERCWQDHRREMVARATLPFVLFPPRVSEDVDPVFLAPVGVQRTRVRLSLRVDGGACLGALTLELFTDVCPLTCQLFTDLLRGDDAGYCYVGTCFFRKVPQLYWSGGDVIHDNGCGCYLQRGRTTPPLAENYHYPHSMPGLVSMRTTSDGEMCGIFNITFKPLPQFDLKNVVFARVVRPSRTYDTMRTFGRALSTRPVVRVEAAR